MSGRWAVAVMVGELCGCTFPVGNPAFGAVCSTVLHLMCSRKDNGNQPELLRFLVLDGAEMRLVTKPNMIME